MNIKIIAAVFMTLAATGANASEFSALSAKASEIKAAAAMSELPAPRPLPVFSREKAATDLSVPETIEILTSMMGWDLVSKGFGAGGCRVYEWRELLIRKAAEDKVTVPVQVRYYPEENESFIDFFVTGPVLEYWTTVNVCTFPNNDQCNSILKNRLEIVSRDLVKVEQQVFQGGQGAGVATGQKLRCEVRRPG